MWCPCFAASCPSGLLEPGIVPFGREEPRITGPVSPRFLSAHSLGRRLSASQDLNISMSFQNVYFKRVSLSHISTRRHPSSLCNFPHSPSPPKTFLFKVPCMTRKRTGHSDAPRMLRLLQAVDRLPRHRQRGRLPLHVRGASLRCRFRHGAPRSGRRRCAQAGREQGRDRARQGGVGGAEEG